MRITDILEAEAPVRSLLLNGRQTLEWLRDHDQEENASQIKYFIPQYAYDEVHVLILRGDELLAMGGFEINPADPHHLWVKFITTRPDQRRKGYARLIYQTIYPWAEKHRLKIHPGGLTHDGAQMAHIHDEMYQRYPGAAFRRDEAGNYVNDRNQMVRSSDRSESF